VDDERPLAGDRVGDVDLLGGGRAAADIDEVAVGVEQVQVEVVRPVGVRVEEGSPEMARTGRYLDRVLFDADTGLERDVDVVRRVVDHCVGRDRRRHQPVYVGVERA
jgi:hypothetical protein